VPRRLSCIRNNVALPEAFSQPGVDVWRVTAAETADNNDPRSFGEKIQHRPLVKD
jgi:hypothetical protein